MIGKPAPTLCADPGVTESFVPLPLAVAKWRPALADLRFPGHPEFGCVDPFSIRVQVAQAVMQARQTISGRVAGQQLVASQTPCVGRERRDLRQQVEFVRPGEVEL